MANICPVLMRYTKSFPIQSLKCQSRIHWCLSSVLACQMLQREILISDLMEVCYNHIRFENTSWLDCTVFYLTSSKALRHYGPLSIEPFL